MPPADLWILDDGLVMGGGQRFGLRLARALTERGVRVRFLSPADSAFGREVVARGYALTDVSYPRLLPPAVGLMPGAVATLRRALETAPSDAVLVGNTARCQAYATAAVLTMARARPLVHIIHEQTSVTRPSARAVYRRIGGLVAVGDQTAELYRRNLPGVTVHAITNFLDAEQVQRVTATRTPPPGGPRPVVGFLGRLIRRKGVLELVEELATVPDTWERLRIAAPPQDEAYTAEIRAAIAAHGLDDRVELLGGVDDVDAFLSSVDALVVPSVGFHEGQPTVILEGLLHGRQVICRAQLRSPQLEGLPLGFYDSPAELGALLAGPPPEPVDADAFLERFGPGRVVDTVLHVASEQQVASGPQGYFDWHGEPGYFRDVTRHFPADARMLDIGCGTAWLAEHFADYVGVDDAEGAIAYARSRGRDALRHSVDERLPFDDASFDGVVIKDVLEHVADPVGVVREALRVLRPGGRLFASSPDAQRWVWDDYTHRRPFTRKSYRLLFADHGFLVERIGYESVMPGIGIVSGLTERRRRPRALGALAHLPVTRRNVYAVARKPA